MYRKTIVLSLIVLAVLALTACGGEPAPPERLVFGIVYTEQVGDLGFRNAVEIAMDEYNARGIGIPVEVEWMGAGPEEDPFGLQDTDIEVELLQRAIDNPEVVLVYGGPSADHAIASVPVANDAGLAYIGGGSAWAGLTRPGYGPGEPGIYYPSGVRNFFRAVTPDYAQGRLIADWIVENTNAESIYLVTDGSVHSFGVMGQLELTIHDAGLDVIALEEFNSNDHTREEIQAMAAQIVDADPDVLSVIYNVPLLYEVRALDPNMPIVGVSIFEVTLMEPPEGYDISMLEGTYYDEAYPNPAYLDTQAAADFIEAYESRYGPLDPSWAGQLAASYEAIRVGLYGIEQAEEPTRAGVVESLSNLSGYSGIYGEYTFVDGDRTLNVTAFLELVDGQWETLEVISEPND